MHRPTRSRDGRVQHPAPMSMKHEHEQLHSVSRALVGEGPFVDTESIPTMAISLGLKVKGKWVTTASGSL